MAFYALDSPTGTYSAGTSLVSMDGDAQSAGGAFLNATRAVATGDGVVDKAVDEFWLDVKKPVEKMADDVERLGTNVQNGGYEAQDVNNNGVALLNAHNSNLSRTVNTPTVM